MEEKIKNVLIEHYVGKCLSRNEIKKEIKKIANQVINETTDVENKSIKNMLIQYVNKISDVDELYQFVLEKKMYSTFIYTTKIEFPLIKNPYEPMGTQWIHDIQIDDEIDEILKQRTTIYEQLRKIILPEQCTPEWFKMREGKITASNVGTVLGMNKYEYPCEYIKKKITNEPFPPNKNCYHGKKYEEIASMVYQYRMNVYADSFGLIEDPEYKFLGASPDNICSPYKYDKIHLSKFVGRMLEIKCPTTRTINTTGDIKGTIVPLYYWAQVQMQLQACNLCECDFFQCNIHEYHSRHAWLSDTNPNEQFRSKTTNFEKGVLIQLLPKNKSNDEYYNAVYESSIFIHPPKIEMTPYECDQWILIMLDELKESHPKHVFDKIIYWRLNNSHCVTVERDSEWFKSNVEQLKKIHNLIEFLKKDEQKTELVVEQFRKIGKINNKTNAEIMNYMFLLMNHNDELINDRLENNDELINYVSE